MRQDRRTFLKTTALAGAAAAGASALATPALAQRTAAPTTGSQQIPKGFVFATLRRPNGYGLGVRTDRGILDVATAEQEFRENAPTTIDAVFKGQGDINGLKRLVDRASASPLADRYFVALDKAGYLHLSGRA